MRRLISIFLVFNLILFPLAAESIKIETSKGTQELVIPPEEELRDAFIEMSKLYIEERFAYEDLIAASQELTKEVDKLNKEIDQAQSSIDTYINENNLLRGQYKSLVEEYNDLIDTLEKKNRLKPIKGIMGIELGLSKFESPNIELVPAVEIGAFIFEKVMITTRVAYPWELGLGVNFTF